MNNKEELKNYIHSIFDKAIINYHNDGFIAPIVFGFGDEDCIIQLNFTDEESKNISVNEANKRLKENNTTIWIVVAESYTTQVNQGQSLKDCIKKDSIVVLGKTKEGDSYCIMGIIENKKLIDTQIMTDGSLFGGLLSFENIWEEPILH